MSFDAVIFLPPRGSSYAEIWLAEGRLACTQDLIQRLQSIPNFQRILVLAASQEDQFQLKDTGVQLLTPIDEFHFGRALSQVIRKCAIKKVAYFGGASAPLANQQFLQEASSIAANLPAGSILPNNFHSTDWAFITSPELIETHVDRLPNDNALGWVLHREADFNLESMPMCGGSRFDVDTPSDLLIAHRHPDIGDHLRHFYETIDQSLLGTSDELRTILSGPSSTITLIGRVSSHIWSELERRTRAWIRLFVEERGMVASGRLARGEVLSLLTRITEVRGLKSLIDFLERSSTGVFWDTRVWLAATGGYPSPADRFAADLGRIADISEARLRELTESILGSNTPILAGGHGIVSGGLLALLESLEL